MRHIRLQESKTLFLFYFFFEKRTSVIKILTPGPRQMHPLHEVKVDAEFCCGGLICVGTCNSNIFIDQYQGQGYQVQEI